MVNSAGAGELVHESSEGEYRRRNRVELLILFPTGPLRRKLPQAGKDIASDEHQLEIDQLFGNCDWREIYRAQRDRWIGGEASWMHYVNLYRLGLSRLGYSYTSAIEVRNTKQVVQYHLIFATSNQAGLRIMNGVLQKAREILPGCWLPSSGDFAKANRHSLKTWRNCV